MEARTGLLQCLQCYCPNLSFFAHRPCPRIHHHYQQSLALPLLPPILSRPHPQRAYSSLLCVCVQPCLPTYIQYLWIHNSCLFTIAKVLTFEVLSLVTAARTLAHAGQLHKRPHLLLRKLHSKRRGQRSLICSHTLLLAAVQVALADRLRSLRHQRFSSQGK